MSLLILGLLLFLGAHSVRIVADGWRTAQIARLGEPAWKGLYTLVSLVGFALIAYGYGQARAEPLALWTPPPWSRHAASLLTVPAFILLVAAYVPGTRIKAAVGHPMVAGVKLWALAHLLANGTLADLLLFGAFLLWAVADFASARRRDRTAGRTYAATGWGRDVIAVVVGLGVAVLFMRLGHEWLIGVRPY